MIDHVPAFYGARHNAGHTATVFHPGGGEYANVATNWLLWTFKNDKKAAKMFTGKDCDLCTNSNWDVRAERFPGRARARPVRRRFRAAAASRLAERWIQSRAGEVQDSAAAVRHSRSRRRPRQRSAAPPDPVLPAPSAIPGVLAAGQSWKVVWSWEGNNVDGPIAADNGTVLFANNDASNVMQLDPATGLAKIVYRDTNTGGAVSRSRNGALFVAERGLGSAIEQLEPQRKMLANSFHGEPLDCVGGVVNDLTADARGGVYFSVTGAVGSGVFYADPNGVVSQYGKDVPLANGIILSRDEKTLYVTNGGVVFAFDVTA